ncbi:hypothetical protein SAMN05421679_107229 [Epilithonimonas pallida]|uniref:Uncharacterized protein n=2 Tax=Epilithonimonas pallida TaxID=373671 RepID=A0ABY1R5C9_9FLAO|nr:hypothetical protein SAMN05421679_107229 [Epilithonimonas pallida]
MVKTQMIRKKNTVSPLMISGRYFCFLVIFLFASIMSYAACKPEDAYAGSQEEGQAQSGKIYISEGAALVIAEDTTISGAEIIHTDAADIQQPKSKPLKTITEKPKAEHKTAASSQPISPAPVETVSPNDSKHTWSTNAPYNKQLSITYNISFKYIGRVINIIAISVILILLMILIPAYRRPPGNDLFLGCNLQRPPPISL